MSALLKETQALINSVINKTKDLETDVIRLQKQFDVAGSLPPYVQVELNSDRPKTMHSVKLGRGCMVHPLGHVPMNVFAIFNPANNPPANQDWCQIAKWDESLVDILEVVIRLKVVEVDS
ncbi:hypothetical protein Clacol_004402 [Clathrus columnatus]|uniref:Uncharacterized protein n=1 Tax=Clathrus columnatus TaxID=1419009 RepID=A0AAV5ACF9_9AGAM|nr:hypothetical protein Clacol_004402 [Clathrus columnatus]